MARPRKSLAKRKPGGRLVQDELESRHGAATVKRMLDFIATNVRQPEYGTVLGLLAVQKKITPAEFDAGCKLATLRAMADRALGVPPRNPIALRYEGTRGMSCLADNPERELEAIERFEKMEAHFGALSRCWSAMQEVCIYDRMLNTHEDRVAFKMGIRRLAEYFGLQKGLTNQSGSLHDACEMQI